ncbi:cytochrome P450 CYP749A22-like [Andrographis paniculata]|uniref:cytochrome P450 CYP749A22-like n=1 Tax=Andrographis paniculata TaxID=175694 RepID=UPI0021E7FFC9|nr:cytochrome P450 CYP749A22-like [Andrographis paniculata]
MALPVFVLLQNFPIVLVVCCAVVVLVTLSRLIYKLWCRPILVQNRLRAQGLKGNSYRFLHGDNCEIVRMKEEAIKAPCELTHHDLFPRIVPHYHAWMKLYGENFFYWMGPKAAVVVTEAELVKEVLGNNDGAFGKVKVVGHAKKYLGDGLVVAEGQKWSRLRKIANHAFHGNCLKEMFPAMVASVDTMLVRWASEGSREVEVTEEFRILTSEVISRTAFGSSYIEGKNIFKMLTELGNLVAKNMHKMTFFGLEKLWRFKEEIESDKIEKSLHDSVMTLIRKREESVKSGFGKDFLGSLLKVHHDNDPNTRISVDDVIDECKVFYIAGHETTSTVMPWIVVLLSVYTDWQDKVRQEVLQIFGQDKPTPEGISRMKILTMVINETLRLYTPVVALNRKVDKKTKLGRYEIPANVELIVPSLALHRNPEIWGDDAHLFNPERFSEGVAKATNGMLSAFIAFGYGPRSCVGNNFAMNEIKITLAMILQRYKFVLSKNYVHSPFQFLTINARHGVPIVLHPLEE